MAYTPTKNMYTAGTGTSGYNVTPAPRTGTSAFGMVPGAVGLPNPYADLSRVYPNLGPSQAQASQNILGELKGELSPETIDAIQNASAAWGVGSGMPGSGLAGNRSLRDLGLATEQIQGKGLQDYLAAITGISGTQTVRPELQYEVALQNALWGAAPDPAQAAQRQLDVWGEQYNLENAPPSVSVTHTPAGPGGAEGQIYTPGTSWWDRPALRL